MRELVQYEKDILIKINKTGRQNISTFLVDNIPDLILYLNRDENTLKLQIESKDSEYIKKRAIEMTQKIISIVSFLVHIKREGYVYASYLAHGRTLEGTMGKNKIVEQYKANYEKYSGWSFTDKEIKKLIYDYWDLILFPTESLKTLIKNKFKTVDEIKHKQIVTLTAIAIIVSALIGIVGIYLNYYVINRFDKDNIKQQNFFKQHFKEIQQNQTRTIDSLNRYFNEIRIATVDTNKEK